MISDFRSGLTFWWRGWGHLLKHRSLLSVAIMPLILSGLFAFGFVWLIFSYLPFWVHSLIGAVIGIAAGFWYDLIYYPLIIGGGLVVFVAALYVSFLLLRLVAVPFYALLAERTLNQLGKTTDTSWPTLLRMFRSCLVKTLILLLIGVVLFVFSFVPVLNVLAIAAALFIMAFDCMDFAFEACGMGLRKRVTYLIRERAQWSGMALGLALTLPIPGLTLLVIPGAVVGCALILKEHK
ncbi:MAG: EI24 domain-containing protein [Bdellovibrionales bacterium]|nr:EI24 domain-containing protein [Bdellovibrionales bacterium]